MSENQQEPDSNSNEDRFVDAISAVAIVLFPVVAIIYWLSGM